MVALLPMALGIQSFRSPNLMPNSNALGTIVYITGCPTAYAMYVNIVGTSGDPSWMEMEDDIMEYSISGTETFYSDHDIKYWIDLEEEIEYPMVYVWIKILSTSSWTYVGPVSPLNESATLYITGNRLTSLSIPYNCIPQP